MRKTIMTILLCAISATVLTSCSKYNESGAESYLQSKMKSPSTFKVIDTRVTEKECTFIYDTTYHIAKIYGETFAFDPTYYITKDSALVDSIKIERRDYPASIIYNISYDAQNAFGATLRDSAEVYQTDETFRLKKEYNNWCYEQPRTIIKYEPTSLIIKNDIKHDFILIEVDKWCDLKKYY